MKVTQGKRKIRLRINKALRTMNEDIAKDPLWKGRFIVRVREMRIEQYEDKSGYSGTACIAFIDRETGRTTIKYLDYYDITGLHWGSGVKVGWKLFDAMNSFIIDECKVWETNSRPTRETTIDYTKIPCKY